MSRIATVLSYVVAGSVVGAVLSAAAVGLSFELVRRGAVRLWGVL
jgi:hypothetical protein